MRDFITASEVAALLGLTDAPAFHRQRDRLEDDHDFPIPMPQCRRPFLWRRDQVQAWIDAQGGPKATPQPAPRGPNVVLLQRAMTA